MKPHDIDSNGLIWDCWRRHAERTPEREAIVHVAVDQPPSRWRWGSLMRAA